MTQRHLRWKSGRSQGRSQKVMSRWRRSLLKWAWLGAGLTAVMTQTMNNSEFNGSTNTLIETKYISSKCISLLLRRSLLYSIVACLRVGLSNFPTQGSDFGTSWESWVDVLCNQPPNYQAIHWSNLYNKMNKKCNKKCLGQELFDEGWAGTETIDTNYTAESFPSFQLI